MLIPAKDRDGPGIFGNLLEKSYEMSFDVMIVLGLLTKVCFIEAHSLPLHFMKDCDSSIHIMDCGMHDNDAIEIIGVIKESENGFLQLTAYCSKNPFPSFAQSCKPA